jgi:hypothetical protein
MSQLVFFIVAPEEKIDAGTFTSQSDPDHIYKTVQHRVSEYQGEKDKWYQDWFLPSLSKVSIECLSWEFLINTISKYNSKVGLQIEKFYLKCLELNSPLR